MQNKPTDMQTMVDTMALEDVMKIQGEALGQLISATGAMIKLKKLERGDPTDPNPFEIMGYISANMTEPVMSCYTDK